MTYPTHGGERFAIVRPDDDHQSLVVGTTMREEYFRELGQLIASGRQLSDSERVEFLARHDQYSVPAD